jgi:hypothetical protein
MKNRLFLSVLIISLNVSFSQKNSQKYEFFEPGKIWLDTDGNPIAAHGAGLLYHEGTYYWYGEARKSFHSFPGFPCYSSKDLLNWKNEGYALKPELKDMNSEIHESNIIERPKVIYNAKTKKFVMWMHVEDSKYQKANAGVAIADSPTGPFTFIKSIRPNGHEARDMSLFQDDDGKAYLIHASEKNSTQHINLLTDDYLDVEGTYNRTWIYQWREVPTIFKHKGKYYSITSLCTGFSPNAALWAVADNIMGEWKIMDNPCKGLGSESSFRTQVAYVLPVAAKPGMFIYVADRWTPTTLSDSRYVWLPIEMKEDNKVEVKWYEKWNFEKKTEGIYTENPQGSKLEISKTEISFPSTATPPAVFVKRRIPEQDYSALGWLGWKEGKILLNVMVYPESSSSLDGNIGFDDDLFDLWLDYFQISVSANGAIWRVIPGGGGMGDHSGIALTQRFSNPALKCTVTENVTNKYASLLQLPENQVGKLYSIEISEALALMLPIKEGRVFSFALVVNNRDRSGKGIKNRGTSPLGFRWADTDTYHRLVLKK